MILTKSPSWWDHKSGCGALAPNNQPVLSSTRLVLLGGMLRMVIRHSPSGKNVFEVGDFRVFESTRQAKCKENTRQNRISAPNSDVFRKKYQFRIIYAYCTGKYPEKPLWTDFKIWNSWKIFSEWLRLLLQGKVARSAYCVIDVNENELYFRLSRKCSNFDLF